MAVILFPLMKPLRNSRLGVGPFVSPIRIIAYPQVVVIRRQTLTCNRVGSRPAR